jgi:malate/lactate dehydrogenase
LSSGIISVKTRSAGGKKSSVCDTELFILTLQGQHGIDKDVFLSLPCILGENGVTHILKQPLTEEEKKMLHKSAALMAEVQSKLKM